MVSNHVDNLVEALKLVEEAYAQRTDENNSWHGGALYGAEKTAWAKVRSNLRNLAGVTELVATDSDAKYSPSNPPQITPPRGDKG